MFIFSQEAGKVGRIISDADTASAVIQFAAFDFESLHAIVDATGMQFRPAFQVTDTLGAATILSTFGESVGMATLTGKVFETFCDGTEIGQNRQRPGPNIQQVQDNSLNTRTGIENIITWWNRNNVSARESPLVIRVGFSSAVRVFVTDMQISMRNAEYRIWDFSLSLIRIPPREEIDEQLFNSVAPPDISDVGSPPIGDLVPIGMQDVVETSDVSQLQSISAFSGAAPWPEVFYGRANDRTGLGVIDDFSPVGTNLPDSLNSPLTLTPLERAGYDQPTTAVRGFLAD